MKTIAIIGAGFSGTMTAVNLLSNKDANYRVLLFDPSPNMGKGVAYGVDSLAFLLNVPADSMGAFPDQANHFANWIKEKQLPYEDSDFVPRKLYGDYLLEMIDGLSTSTGRLEKRSLVVEKIEADSKKLILSCADETKSIVDAVVIATGYPRQKFSFLNPHEAQSYEGIEKCRQIAMIGSGLTAVDVLEQARKLGYRGDYVVISRSARFPYAHSENKAASVAADLKTLKLAEAGIVSLPQLVKCLKQDIINFGVDKVLHEMRPFIVSIWQSLSIKDKAQFFRRLESRWNRIRHRMPKSSSDNIGELIKQGRLDLVSGSFKNCEIQSGSSYKITYIAKGNLQQIEVDKAFDCRGPDFSPRSNSLIASLIDQGILELSELRRGIKACKSGRTTGPSLAPIYLVGPLRREDLLETTAVRELREQAFEVSKRIIEDLSKI